MQRRFSIATLAAGLAIAAAVLFAHGSFLTLPDRKEIGPGTAELRFQPITLDRSQFEPLRLTGAWRIDSDDPRVAGLSALTVDGNHLIVVTDSGVVIRFPKAIEGALAAHISELPGGPGNANQKRNRDSEAIAGDPRGRGWWVAFENSNELWLYDQHFSRPLGRALVPESGLTLNRGIEGLAATDKDLLLLPEKGGRLLRFSADGWGELQFDFGGRRSSALATLSGTSVLAIERQLTLLGVVNSLVRLDRCKSGYCLAWRKRLPLGLIDNVEGIAVEHMRNGGARLWLVTDDNGRKPLRTLLVAAELPPQR